MSIGENIRKVKENIARAQARSPLAAKEIMLVGVSKTKPVSLIQQALSEGLLHLGENRVQELLEKYPQIPEASWHLIGHLQTNKVKYLMGEEGLKVKLIHSLDRLSLAQELNKRAEAFNLTVPVLVQVNIADEDTKFGLKEEEAEDFILAMDAYPSLKVQGLMTIGPFVDNPQEIRPVFAALRRLFQRIDEQKLPHGEMVYLSMGMSNDYEIAVEEGANLVRIGSSIFGGR